MDTRVRDTLARKLRTQRNRIWEEATAADSELRALAEIRESELEEAAQQERMARITAGLDLRAKHEIEEIDAALMRLAEGRYGSCLACGRPIAVSRLRAVPATRWCIRCARGQPPAPTGEAAEAAVAKHPGPVPADEQLLTDRELEEQVRELIASDGRVDLEELRIVCRHGIVHLAGTLPSEAEHQIVLRVVTDLAGLREVVDRVRIEEGPWERPERSRARRQPPESPAYQPDTTEDVVRSAEEGVDYVPPDLPPEPEK
jgi:RNA polymerase-binding transcription factor DksA